MSEPPPIVFDNIPITVPGVYRFRADATGVGKIRVYIFSGIPEVVVDSAPSLPFSRYTSLKGAGWYFLKPLP